LSTAPQFPLDYGPQEGPREVPPAPQRRRARWKKVLVWTGGVIAVLIVLIVVATIVVLHSQSVHRYMLRVAQEKASTALGTRVSLRDFGLHFSGISPVLDLYDISIAGTPPHTSNGVLTLLSDRLQITQFRGTLGGGDFSVSGGVVYRPEMRFDVALFTHEGDFDVCGEAENGREAVEKAQQLLPELIVTDLSMPMMNGLEETRALKKLMPTVPVVIYTAHSDPMVEKEAAAAGVSAVVSKSEAASVLIATARSLLDQIAA
jgi:CheY-like chemotaxis protein